MAKLALLTTVALSRTDYVSVLCLYLTNKYGIHIQAAHACTYLCTCAYDVNAMNKQFLRLYDSMITDIYLCKVG